MNIGGTFDAIVPKFSDIHLYGTSSCSRAVARLVGITKSSCGRSGPVSEYRTASSAILGSRKCPSALRYRARSAGISACSKRLL